MSAPKLSYFPQIKHIVLLKQERPDREDYYHGNQRQQQKMATVAAVLERREDRQAMQLSSEILQALEITNSV